MFRKIIRTPAKNAICIGCEYILPKEEMVQFMSANPDLDMRYVCNQCTLLITTNACVKNNIQIDSSSIVPDTTSG